MPSIILIHETRAEIRVNNYPSTYCELMIQVIFDMTYTIWFHEIIPRNNRSGDDCITYVEKGRYIRDIPYFPNAVLDAIKLMHLSDGYGDGVGGVGNNFRFYDLTDVSAPSPGDEIFDGLSLIFSDKFSADIKTEDFTQEITKIKMEHNRTQKELIDTHYNTHLELIDVHNQTRRELINAHNLTRRELIDTYDRTQMELTGILSELTNVMTEIKMHLIITHPSEFESDDTSQKNVPIHSFENDLQ